MSDFVDTARRGMEESDRKRDGELRTPDDIQRFDDIVYGDNETWQVLDVYRPKDIDVKLPVIISVHGGAWIYGSKEEYQFYCMNLAQRGFAVVNFTYRLAPEYKFPAGIEDTNMVVQWCLDHEEEYMFDIEHIFMVGDSAGGHMLSIYSVLCTNPEYAKTYPFSVAIRKSGTKAGTPFRPCAIALNCGVYQFHGVQVSAGDTEMAQLLMRELLEHQATEAELKWISTVFYVTGDFPPAYIMTANNDQTVNAKQAQLLIEKLNQVEATYTAKEYGTKEAPLGHVFHCNIQLDEATACNDDECEFFRKYC